MGSNGTVRLFSDSEFAKLTGSSTPAGYFVGVSNGDYNANTARSLSAYYKSNDGIYVSAAEGWSNSSIRLNYLICVPN